MDERFRIGWSSQSVAVERGRFVVTNVEHDSTAHGEGDPRISLRASGTSSEVGKKRSWLSRPAIIMFSLALVIAALGFIVHPPVNALPAGPDIEIVNMPDVTPIYGDRAITWDEVKRLQEDGHALVSFVYMDDSGNFARVFDTDAELHDWACSGTVPKFVRPPNC